MFSFPMIGDVLGGFVAPAQRAPTKLERARIKRRQLARKAVARREESLLHSSAPDCGRQSQTGVALCSEIGSAG